MTQQPYQKQVGQSHASHCQEATNLLWMVCHSMNGVSNKKTFTLWTSTTYDPTSVNLLIG